MDQHLHSHTQHWFNLRFSTVSIWEKKILDDNPKQTKPNVSSSNPLLVLGTWQLYSIFSYCAIFPKTYFQVISLNRRAWQYIQGVTPLFWGTWLSLCLTVRKLVQYDVDIFALRKAAVRGICTAEPKDDVLDSSSMASVIQQT